MFRPGIPTASADGFIARAGQSGEKKLTDIGEGVRASPVEALGGEEMEEAAEDVIEVREGAKFAGAGDEFGGDDFGVFPAVCDGGVAEAERRMGVREEIAATAASGVKVLASGGIGNGLLFWHGIPSGNFTRV